MSNNTIEQSYLPEDTDTNLLMHIEVMNYLKTQGVMISTLTQKIESLSEKVAFLEKVAIQSPLYFGEGIYAIHRMGNWYHGGLFVVPTTHMAVLSSYVGCGGGNAESGVRKILEDHTPPNAIAVDIGAHVGLHSVTMGYRIRDKGRLVMFEPNPNLIDALRYTMELNRIAHCTEIVEAAVSHCDGISYFNRAMHSPESSLYPNLEDMPNRDRIEVKTYSLDSYFEAGTHIGMIKIDAEGAEAAIFRGMKRVLSENPSVKIVMEFAPIHFDRAKESPALFLAELGKSGFRVRTIAEPDGKLSDISTDELLGLTTANLFLVRA